MDSERVTPIMEHHADEHDTILDFRANMDNNRHVFQSHVINQCSKRCSIRIIVYIIASTLLMFSTSMSIYNVNHKPSLPLDGQITVDEVLIWPNDSSTTSSACNVHFRLDDRVKVSVCHQHLDPVIDIREFINERPTIKGIQLQLREWKDLIAKIPFIRREVKRLQKRLDVKGIPIADTPF